MFSVPIHVHDIFLKPQTLKCQVGTKPEQNQPWACQGDSEVTSRGKKLFCNLGYRIHQDLTLSATRDGENQDPAAWESVGGF